MALNGRRPSPPVGDRHGPDPAANAQLRQDVRDVDRPGPIGARVDFLFWGILFFADSGGAGTRFSGSTGQASARSNSDEATIIDDPAGEARSCGW